MSGRPSTDTTVVVPTVGRPSLVALLRVLADQTLPLDAPVVLVDDRPAGPDLLTEIERELGADHGLDLRVARAGGGGPARARNLGWRRARTTWVSGSWLLVPSQGCRSSSTTTLGPVSAAAAVSAASGVRVSGLPGCPSAANPREVDHR